ncbi:unnamed protein product [Mytilus edulis]|uniref:Uncharacterized protein n=1 Tax=Mytilus edulis TaxID=6550 RepID=A0A8S3U3V5_MYTED|nr:unnamed protein product [Mytilus edulis]
MEYTPVFFNAMFVLLIGVYVYKNERRIADIWTTHDGTGVTYIRWGKKLCDGSNTETIYSGQVGGGHYAHTGASVNYVCLPNDPDVAQPLKPHCDYDLIYGAEYQIGAYNQPQGMRSGIENRDAACAVCLAKGRDTCYKGWTKEYSGILMAGKYDHSASSEYACVDNDAEAISDDSKDDNGILFYPVKQSADH